jgi:hypothetical protein
MNIRQLEAIDAEEYRRLRLWGLQESPSAFGSTYAEEIRMPLGSFVLGAFSDAGRPVGTIGCYGEDRMELRHRGMVWGTFVASNCRRLD